MTRRYSVSRSPHLASLLLLLVSYLAPGEAVLCYSCSYTYTAQHVGYECVNATEEVKTAPSVNCPGQYCRDRVVYKKHEGNEFVVSSLERSCLRQPHSGPNCTQSLYERTCVFVCEGAKCNNKDLSYRKPAESGSVTTFMHYTFASVALTNLLLNMIL